MKIMKVRSDVGSDWKFVIQSFFYDNYYPELAGVDEVDERKLGKYHAIRKFYHEHFHIGKHPFIDIGANVGLAMLGLAVDGVMCYPFEPIEQNLNLLRANIDANEVFNRVPHLSECALSDTTEEGKIYVPERHKDNCSLILSAAECNVRKTEIVEFLPIHVTTFDEYFKDWPTKPICGLVKIDVQGNELRVLKGMAGFLGRCETGTAFIIEIEDKFSAGAGHRREDVVSFLQAYGIRPVAKPEGLSDEVFMKLAN